jgi:patatin-related protein
MAPESKKTQENTDPQEVSETRIALTFFGGVSLAVYETGAAVEFFRLVTGDGVYAKLRERIGPVVIDIISGTSAGALSAAFLANALINQSRSMDPVMKLWLEKADLDTLFHREKEKRETSLLNGNKFLDLIAEALEKQLEPNRVPKPYQQYLDLFITATSLEGDVKDIQLDKGLPIKARSHQRVFHFRYRGDEAKIDEEKPNDFEPSRLRLLAQAARASASFPLAFDPVLIKKDEFAELSPDLKEDCHHIDGGILDNKPIKLAIEAIAHRQADKQIDRRLFYVEPLPEEINPAAGAAQREELAPQHLKPINVLYAAVKDLPAYQSITSALEEIDSRNRELDALRRTLLHYETLARKAGDEGVQRRFFGRLPRLVKSARMWGPSAATDGKYHSGADILTRLFRAQEDGYLDLRLERLLASAACDDCQQIGREIHRRSEEENPKYARAHKEFYHLKHSILDIRLRISPPPIPLS